MLEIAYLNYGRQSGVTERLRQALEARGHRVRVLNVVGPLEYRDPATRRLRLGATALLHLAAAGFRFGRQALHHRWNTPFAFDRHTEHADAKLASLPRRPDVVLQAGALFSPGVRPAIPYVLLLDNTRKLAMRSAPVPEAGLGPPVDYGEAWLRRERKLYEEAAGHGTFSQRVIDSLERDYGVPRERASVVGAGPNVFPEELVREDDGRTLLFIGTRFDLKGGPLLLRAFESLRRKRPDLRLLIAGPTEVPSLPEGAEHLGYLPFERLQTLLRRATVFVLPTLREAFGLAYLDAMAFGLPCVGTRVEAVPEIVEDGVTGRLVQPGNAMALADAIESLLADPARAREMGAQGRERVAEHWRWERVAERMEALLLRAARSGERSRSRAV